MSAAVVLRRSPGIPAAIMGFMTCSGDKSGPERPVQAETDSVAEADQGCRQAPFANNLRPTKYCAKKI
jgi:hypothetical protein